MLKKIITLLMIFLLCACASKDNKVLKYKNDKCVIYYPNNEQIKEYAEAACKDGHKDNINFKEKKMGDFLLVYYPSGVGFFTEKDYSELDLHVKNNIDILASELRYQMRKDNRDEAYTSKFLLDTNVENLNVENVKISLNEDLLLFYFPEYDYDVKIPLSIGQSIVDRDFGIKHDEYKKRRYVNPDRPMIALTFDDGPYKKVEDKLYRIMETYDSRCTFYYVGSRFTETELENCKVGLALGLEYGSHSQNHERLTEMDVKDAEQTITQVCDEFNNRLAYKMNTYRPPYGFINEDIEKQIDMTAILWNVDSLDWQHRDRQLTYENVINNISDNDVVLLHSLYDTTAEAMEDLVPDLIDEGYQLVTVSELMQHLNIDTKVFGGK